MATPGRKRWARPAAEAALVMVALLLMLAAAAGGFLVGRETADDDGGGETAAAETTTSEATTSEATTTAETETAATTTDEAETETEDGEDVNVEAVYQSAGCGGCHTFQAAGSSGTVGPNLDQTDLSKDEIAEQIRNGGGGMPAYEGRLSDDEIDELADFVENAGG